MDMKKQSFFAADTPPDQTPDDAWRRMNPFTPMSRERRS